MTIARPLLARVRATVTVMLHFAVASLMQCAHAAADEPQTKTPTPQLRCGWFENPSPGNASLTDKDGEWTIAVQGMQSATGKWPSFAKRRWVRTGTGSAGYGCACLRVTVDPEQMQVLSIVEARAKPLADCRKDKSLDEPYNPLK